MHLTGRCHLITWAASGLIISFVPMRHRVDGAAVRRFRPFRQLSKCASVLTVQANPLYGCWEQKQAFFASVFSFLLPAKAAFHRS